MASEKVTGTVKWFNNAKGYGFILPDDGGDDLFAHYSSIEMEGYKTLKAGQAVEFEILAGPKGQHATRIVAGAEAEADQAFAADSAAVSVNGVAIDADSEHGNTTEVLSVTVDDGAGLEEHQDDHLETTQARQSS